MMGIRFEVNGAPASIETEADTADEVIRSDLGLTGTKFSCGTGNCGSCVVQVDGVPVASCLLPSEDLDGASVRTIEGIGADALHPVQKAFVAADALQCGFCTPGFVVEAVAFHDAWRAGHGPVRPSRDDIDRALAGHVCRCGAYQGIRQAVGDACEGRYDGGRVAPARVDAVDKVTGAARFTVDVRLPGMLTGRIVRSPLGHADLVDVDISAAVAMPGVRAVVETPPAGGRVRWVGQPFAAVAAEDRATATRAADAIVAHFVERPVMVGIEAALADDAVDIHGRGWRPPDTSEAVAVPNIHRGNLRGPTSVASSHRFRARRAIAAADGDPLLVDNRWVFAPQSHTALEPHACVADWTDDGLVVYASTQSVSPLRVLVARRFGLPVEKVTIVTEHVGGAFGAKSGLGEEVVAAVELSRASGSPVRVVFDRHEELENGGYRPGVELDFAMAGSADGGLPPFVSTAHTDAGTSSGHRVSFIHRLVYPGSPRALVDYEVLTNAPPGKPFRAPNAPSAFAGLEGSIDEYANRLGRDPVDLRKGWGGSAVRTGVYDWVAGRSLWRDRRDPGDGRFRRSVGVAFGSWILVHDPDVRVSVGSSAGGFSVGNASQDLGNGTRTSLAAAVAAVFGVGTEMIAVDIGTSSDLWGPPSTGSRTTASVFPAATAAAATLRGRLVDAATERLDFEGAEPVDGGLFHAGELIPWTDVLERLPEMTESAARPSDTRRSLLPVTVAGSRLGTGLTHAAHIVEVEVDTRLGRIRPIRVDAVLAAGKIHVPALARSQAYGGVIQGIGHALYEERLLDPRSGLNVSLDLDGYQLAGIADMPETVVEFIEEGFETVAGGGVGLSELATAGVAGAVGNAVSRALGHRMTRFPIRPQDVVELMT